MSKKVIFWEPKRTEKRKPDGSTIAGEFIGKFRTKVGANTKGAIRHSGTLANGRDYDYWGLDVDSVSGKLRWIDKQDNGDYGTNLVLFLETEQFLHRVSVKYDPYSLKNVMNHLCGLKSHVATQVINLSFWVRKSLDKDKNVKTDKDGKVIWKKDLSFRDISPEFDYDQWTAFSQQNGLDWFQEKRADGSKPWNSDAEYKYWDGRLLGLQKHLLKTENVLPFCYNSMTACEAPNPSGGGNLTAQEIELTKEIYERVKSEYRFPFNRSDVSADDAFNQPEIEERATPLPHPDTVLPSSQPTQRQRDEADSMGFVNPANDVDEWGTPPDTSDLPF